MRINRPAVRSVDKNKMGNVTNNKNTDDSKNNASKFAGIVNFNGNFQMVREKNSSKMSGLPVKPAAEKISNNRILGSLSDFDAVRLMPYLDFVLLSAGEEIYAAGEPNRYVYFPETAVASDIYDLSDGGTIETAMTGSESAIGLCAILGKYPVTHRIQTIVKGNAWRIKTERLKQEFSRGGEMQTLLLDGINRHINQITQRLVCKSFHLLEKRLCGWLLTLHDRVKKNRFKMTQENIALLLGANRPSITIAALTLRNQGLIDYSRGGIKILDRQGMENSACECYSVLKSDNFDCS